MYCVGLLSWGFLGNFGIDLIDTVDKLLEINLVIPVPINLPDNIPNIILSQAGILKLSDKNLFNLLHGDVTIFVPIE